MICYGFSIAARTTDERRTIAWVATAVMLFGLPLLCGAVIRRRTTVLAITSRRIIAKFGFIRRHAIELNHNQLESVHVDQSVTGQVLDFGTLIINGTGGGTTPIPGVSHPLTFRRCAMEVVDAERPAVR
jgi:Bacterial PH domain